MKASIIRRALGWLIDYVIVMIPAAILVGLAVSALVHALPGYLGAVAAEFGWSHLVRLITHGAGAGLGAAASKEWVTFSAPLIGALLLVPFIQFAYQATLLRWRGRTVGKMLTDTRITVAAGVPRLRGGVARRALTTTVLETGLVCAALAVVVLGQFAIGIFVWLIAVLAFWVNALAALGPRGRTVVDRMAGTTVVRSRLHAELASQTVALTRRTSAAAVHAGRKGSETVLTAGRMTTDAAVVAGQLAREGAQAIAGSAPVQQVANSRAGQQAKALGEQAAGQARQLGGRARQVWQQRLARKATPEHES